MADPTPANASRTTPHVFVVASAAHGCLAYLAADEG